MKILILGATGMLGHKLVQTLSAKNTVTGTIRGRAPDLAQNPVFSGAEIVGNISAENPDEIRQAIPRINPEVVINCIGIVKQLPAARDPLQSIAVNALFPHQLATLCRERNIRLIHLSTDCVFSGRRGQYTENDLSDAEDLYGKTKFLGEVNYPGCLTIRTSIIGRELSTSHGLIEWFLSQDKKTVPGYKKTIFSGLTTIELSEIISKIISGYPSLTGTFHIASEPTSKYDLLDLVKKTYGMGIAIEPDETVVNNRSLDASRFKRETTIKIPSWEYMIDMMHRDPTPYDTLRHGHAHQ
jgi:dTDP-4-dehydrorhamnose reductase